MVALNHILRPGSGAPQHILDWARSLQQAIINGDKNAIGAFNAYRGGMGVNLASLGGGTAQGIGFGSGSTAGLRFSQIKAERDSLRNTVGSFDATASARMNANFANRIWVSPFYNKQSMDQKDGYLGYDYEAWGASVGYDRAIGDCLTFGAAFTFSRGDYDADGVRDDNEIDNYGFWLYGNYQTPSGFFINATGGYNYADNSLKTWIDTPAVGGPNPAPAIQAWNREKFHTSSYWLGGTLGYDFKMTENWTLTPSVGIFWSESKNSAHTMHGAYEGGKVGKITDKSLILPLDLTLGYTRYLSDCSSISFSVSGGYAYNFKDDGAKGKMRYDYANAPEIPILGVKPGKSSWNAGAGIKYKFNRFDIGVNYRYDGKKKFDGHRVNATFGINF